MMMEKMRVISNLYYSVTNSYPFKDVHGSHVGFHHIYNNYISRSVWRITDLDLWFESDLKDGCELIVKRVSENGRYKFK